MKTERKEGWTFGNDGEIYSSREIYEKKEDAVADAIEELGLAPGESFYVGYAKRPDGDDWIPDAEDIIERMLENLENSDYHGDWSDRWLANVKPEAKDALSEAVRAVVAKWMDETGNRPNFYNVIDAEMVIAPKSQAPHE